MKLTDVKINYAAVEAGEWIDGIPRCDDLRVRTRGINCAAFKRLQSARLRALPRKARQGNGVDPVALEELNAICVVEACLIDWGNMTDAAGQEVPFSKENALALISDPDNQHVKDGFVFAAGRVGEERNEDVEQAVGNSLAA